MSIVSSGTEEVLLLDICQCSKGSSSGGCSGEGDPTGGWVWDSAVLACHILAGRRWVDVRGLRVCDLAAGTGVCGIAAGLLGAARVALTEIDACMPNLEGNCDHAGGGDGTQLPPQCVAYRYGEDTAALGGPFDVVLLCDLLYYQGLDVFDTDTLEPLAATVAALLRGGTATAVALLVFETREPVREAEFLRLCAAKQVRTTGPLDPQSLLPPPLADSARSGGGGVSSDVAALVTKPTIRVYELHYMYGS